MSWNHRVIKTGDEYALHECFYEPGADLPSSWTVDPVGVVADDLPALGLTLRWMAEALKKPVLEEYTEGGVHRLREVQ